ncbi:MAG: hypothetical protein N2037_03560 [Acidimicrobiales bacterium]|nr:hypothetical protein [Acidimicrobiales bacterium]
MRSVGHFGRDHPRCAGDDGAGLVEYALLVSLIALVCITAMRFFGQATGNKFTCSAEAISSSYDGITPSSVNC